MNRTRAGFIVINVVLALLATGLAAASFWPVYQDAAFVTMLAVTLAVGAAIALCGALFRWPSIIVAGAAVAAYVVLGVPLAIPSEATGGILPTGQGLSSLLTATWESWKQLVTISLPVGSYQALLVPAFILTLLAIVVCLTVALRAKHGELAALPPVALLAAGILLGPGSSSLPIALNLGLMAILLVWLIWFRWQRRSASIGLLAEHTGVLVETPRERRFAGVRTVVGAAVILVVAGVAGTAAAIVLPARVDRQVVRTAIEQPFDPRAYASPLSGFRNYLEPAESDVPMLTVSGLPADRRIRVATLDTYDGVVYSVGTDQVSSASGSFTRVPSRLEQSGVHGAKDTITVAVRGYSGVWVPGSGQLQQITFAGGDAEALTGSFYYNDTTGTGAVTRGLRSGDAYTLDAVVKPQLTPAQLVDAQPGTAPVPKPAVVPDELTQALQKYSSAQTTPGAKLAAALKGLQADGYISHGIGPNEPVSRSGHGADRITQLLTDDPMVGDQEQYAVTAALMARQLGFPARVVVGFVAPSSAPAGGTVTLTGADISAWIEVQTHGAGWVTVDPTPPIRPIPPKQPETPTQISRPQTNVLPPVDDTQSQRDDPPQAQVDNSDQNNADPLLATILAVLTIVGWTLLGMALVSAPFLAIIGAKWRRRTLRRTAPTSVDRISGGWREFADAAIDHGYNPPPSATRSEFARTVGGSRTAALASVADRAVFGPAAPSPEEADTVWRAVDDLRRALGRRLTPWRRFVALISLRSLGASRGRTVRKTRR
ncbi:transglutaminase domain-containing protein [Diaminobutyricibacter tongyongensis]|uniref:Transglutaminase domain-containing protein n=1 Tax=Leifsonia tongyongensis TaxID=1268043 RepID=A0A6L9Y1E9_9MICO|nr:transglutaminase domain-containing protein [Diaminobutyricibacter tongyongensis]NEN07406.1 transglutaminase domain-containing protein [Diaminobutyricibacter tongyongensis]